MDIVPILFQLLLVFFLIAMNGFFVAAEFACVKIRPSRLETLIQEGSRQAKYAKKLTDHLDASLSVTQLGITLASLGLGWVGEPAVATLILPVTHMLGLDDVIGHTISLALAFSIITGMHIVLGELTPKTMAIQNVEKIMLNVALPMLIFHRVMYPFVWLLNHVANWVAHRLGFHTASEGDDAHTEEEIRLLMEESHRQGLIDDTEVDFVDNVFDFTDLNVREIMTPRTDMICLYLEDSMEDNLNTQSAMRIRTISLVSCMSRTSCASWPRAASPICAALRARPSLCRRVWMSASSSKRCRNSVRRWPLSSTNTAARPAW